MPHDPKTWATGELITAEDLNRLEKGVADVSDQAAALAEDLTAVTARVSTAEGTLDQIRLANTSTGEGAPTGTAPVGWRYIDLATGDHYRMEA